MGHPIHIRVGHPARGLPLDRDHAQSDGACQTVNDVGKPYAGELHVRFEAAGAGNGAVTPPRQSPTLLSRTRLSATAPPLRILIRKGCGLSPFATIARTGPVVAGQAVLASVQQPPRCGSGVHAVPQVSNGGGSDDFHRLEFDAVYAIEEPLTTTEHGGHQVQDQLIE